MYNAIYKALFFIYLSCIWGQQPAVERNWLFFMFYNKRT